MTKKKKGPTVQGRADKPNGSRSDEKQVSTQTVYSQGNGEAVKGGKRKSSYPPGAAFMPSDETLAKREAEVLELLRRAGKDGITYLTVLVHLQRSLANYICSLRQKDYVIDTLTQRGSGSRFGVYVLRSEPAADE